MEVSDANCSEIQTIDRHTRGRYPTAIPPLSLRWQGARPPQGGLCFFSAGDGLTGSGADRSIVYIDGFNLYYRALKGTKYKWLDLEKLCAQLLPKLNILKIKYFTARIKSRPGDPNQPLRQELYLRALRTLPTVEIYYGRFLSKTSTFPLAPVTHPPQYVRVSHAEEKMSDVNLASHLLLDGFDNAYDVAAVISSDTDFITPYKFVRNRFHKQIWILKPDKKPSVALRASVDAIKPIRKGSLASSQLPSVLHDSAGRIHKPNLW